jgi:muramoyltetrapeptide carboxypeptidase
MPGSRTRIGIVAPASRLTREMADAVTRLAGDAELVFHPQCFFASGHFAGPDDARAQAFLEIANDPAFDAVWFARGGYGSGRIAEDVAAQLTPAARAKTYLGYSDLGYMLAALHKQGCTVAHGPMPADIRRAGGEAAVSRALDYLTRRAPESLEPHAATPSAAFNLTVLSHITGTAIEPDLAGLVLMIEDVSEHHYRIDRALHHVTGSPNVRRAAGLRLGRMSDIPPNDPDFGMDEEAIARHWCAVAGIAYLGRADIGHDADNKVVPFGGPHA